MSDGVPGDGSNYWDSSAQPEPARVSDDDPDAIPPTWPLVVEDYLRVWSSPDAGTPIAPWDQLVVADMRQRDAAGFEKYGTRLRPDNGRDCLVDSYQEALDCAVYLKNEMRKEVEACAARGPYGVSPYLLDLELAYQIALEQISTIRKIIYNRDEGVYK